MDPTEDLAASSGPVAGQGEAPTLAPDERLSSAIEGQEKDAGSVLRSERFSEREVLGRGGAGTVVRALDLDLLREVAIKTLTHEIGEGATLHDRFVEEARITGQLEHPNIVPVYEFGTQEMGKRFMCMRLVQGKTLEAVLASAGERRLEPRSLGDLLNIFGKVCEAVSFAHSRGVIHRDLKPLNIMVGDYGEVYVVDWGIAHVLPDGGAGQAVRLARDGDRVRDTQGVPVGTRFYMAPEQQLGQHDAVDSRTDVFALGATLYQILTGQPPLTNEAIDAIRAGKVPPPIPRPESLVPGDRVPLELSRIVMRATAYLPDERYASVADLKREVEDFQRGAWHLPRMLFPAGTVVVTEGEPGDAAYVIAEGECEAYRLEGEREVRVRVMGPGEVFGETAVFTHKPRTASVRAVTDAVLLVVTRDALSKAVGLNSWMGAFVKALADRFREVDERLRQYERANREKGKG